MSIEHILCKKKGTHLLPQEIIFNMGTKTSIHESTTWFDLLPNEIMFLILDYLSSNDIIYAFFFFNQRFNNLLLRNPNYFNYFELPTTNLNTWKKILSVIGSQIESINIIYLSLPLTYFPNLKSIIISSPAALPNDELKSIVKSNQFQNLHSFKIHEIKRENFDIYYTHLSAYNTFKKVFNHKSPLKIFQYSIITPKFTVIDRNDFEINFNLHSLTLNLTDFKEIFSLIEYTPNLKYLNVQSKQFSRYELPLNEIDIKLEQLFVTLKEGYCEELYQSINSIKQFSSSLTCLSLNLVDFYTGTSLQFPFNSNKLQRFLEPMTKLKQFHLYAKLSVCGINHDIILQQFQSQFWFDRNLSFGMHGQYFYTLPFHFDHLYLSYERFDNVKSNNPRIWYNVKSIKLPLTFKYDKELKIKMPKLTSIKFDGYGVLPELRTKRNNRTEEIDVLDNVTSIEFFKGYIENQKDWIIYSLPSLRHLILSDTRLPSTDSELVPILNKRIQQLDIYGDYQLKQLIEISDVYFSNVQNINIYLPNPVDELNLYLNAFKILTNFKNLKTLFIYNEYPGRRNRSGEGELKQAIKYLEKNRIMKNYRVKYFEEDCLLTRI